jgi:hypothetical protein
MMHNDAYEPDLEPAPPAPAPAPPAPNQKKLKKIRNPPTEAALAQRKKFESRTNTKLTIESKAKEKIQTKNHGLESIGRLLSDKTPTTWYIILSSEETMQPATFKFAKSLGVDVYFANEWFKVFRNLNEKWFSSDNLALIMNQPYIKCLKTLLDKLSNPYTNPNTTLANCLSIILSELCTTTQTICQKL